MSALPMLRDRFRLRVQWARAFPFAQAILRFWLLPISTRMATVRALGKLPTVLPLALLWRPPSVQHLVSVPLSVSALQSALEKQPAIHSAKVRCSVAALPSAQALGSERLLRSA